MITKEQILNGEVSEYNFTTEHGLENHWSMYKFLEDFDLFENITLDDGTYVELDDKIACHSGGNGDFCSHKIRFEIL